MLIYIGADHRGFQLKESLKKYLKDSGYEAVDVGNDKYVATDDYPDFAALVGGSGVGVDIAANKFKNVRSALAFNAEQAAMSRSDDNANVLSLAADYLSEDDAKKILSVWLATPFSGEERHRRRLRKIEDLESRI